jgi:hypothetical protein
MNAMVYMMKATGMMRSQRSDRMEPSRGQESGDLQKMRSLIAFARRLLQRSCSTAPAVTSAGGESEMRPQHISKASLAATLARSIRLEISKG